MMRRAPSRSVLAIAVLASSLRAAAQENAVPLENDAESRARALFERGRTLLSEGRAAEACETLTVSNTLVPATGTLLNLGLCHRAQGKAVTAAAYFRAAEQLAASNADDDRRSLAARDADELDAQVGKLVIHVDEHAEPDLAVSLDGLEQPFSRPVAMLLVDPGRHEVEARSEHRTPFRRSFDVRPGERVQIDVPPAVVATRSRPPTPPATHDHGARARAILAIGSGVVGLAGVGAAIGFSVAARSAFDESSPHCTSHDVCDSRGLALRHDADARATRADVAAIVGGVGIAAGVALGLSLVLDGDSKSAGGTAVTVGAQGVDLRGQF